MVSLNYTGRILEVTQKYLCKRIAVVLCFSLVFVLLSCKHHDSYYCAENPICDFALYPNPAVSLVNISFKSNTSQQGSSEIFSLNGQLEMDMRLEILSGENMKEVDISDLSDGVYILHFTSKTDTINSIFVKSGS